MAQNAGNLGGGLQKCPRVSFSDDSFQKNDKKQKKYDKSISLPAQNAGKKNFSPGGPADPLCSEGQTNPTKSGGPGAPLPLPLVQNQRSLNTLGFPLVSQKHYKCEFHPHEH